MGADAVFLEDERAAERCVRQYSYAKNLDEICPECDQAARFHSVPFNLEQLTKLLDTSYAQGLSAAATLVRDESLADQIRKLSR